LGFSLKGETENGSIGEKEKLKQKAVRDLPIGRKDLSQRRRRGKCEGLKVRKKEKKT